MAHIRQRSNGTWEITIRRKNLPKPIHASADTEAEARVWAERMEAQLDSGFIPKEILMDAYRSQKTVAKWLGEYGDDVSVSASDIPLLPIIIKDIGNLQLGQLTRQNLQEWITKMKERRLTYGSIRKGVGALARAMDIAVHRELVDINTVRALPRGYSNYVRNDGVIIEDGTRRTAHAKDV